MFELNPDDRMAALQRRRGKIIKKGELTPALIRNYTTSVTFQSTLMKEFTNVLDYGTDVYCPKCAVTTDYGAVTAYPLAPLLGKNPMADSGDMVSFTCLHCGFVEHHKAPKRLVAEAEEHLSDALKYKYAEYQRQMAKQAQLEARYGGALNVPNGLRNTAAEMQAMRDEMMRVAGMASNPPVASGLNQSLTDFVKKFGGT